MATTDTQALFLQVDASIELLKRNLASADAPMAQFEGRAAQMAQRAEASLAQIGSRLAAFGPAAESTAAAIERDFTDSFNAVQRQAARAIQMPTLSGGLNLGAAEMREAAEAAQRQAQALGLIEQAAMRAAAGEGEMTSATRAYLGGITAARIEAERHAATLLTEAGAVERVEIETRSLTGAQQVAATSTDEVGHASGRASIAKMELMHVVRSSSDAFAAGAPPMQIFTMELGRIAEAASFAGGGTGALGAVGAFLGGPWGLLVTGAVAVLTPFVAKLLEHNDALGEAVQKLRDDAAAHDVDRQAHEAFSHTAEGLTAAIREQDEALQHASMSARQNAVVAENRAEQQLREIITTRAATQATLDYAQAILAANRARASGPGQASEVAALGLSDQDARVTQLQTQLAQNDTSIRTATDAVARSHAAIAAIDAQELSTPIGRINREYTEMARRATDAAIATGHVTTALTAQLLQIEQNHQAALRTEQQREAAARRTDTGGTQIGRQITLAEAREIVQSIGGVVTSSTRSFAEQAALYARYQAYLRGGPWAPIAAAPGHSAHETGQALDVRMTPGMSLARLNAAFEARGVRLSSRLNEGDHFHVGWRSNVGSSASADQHRDAAAQARVLQDDYSYTAEERQARQRLITALGRTADTAEQEDQLARDNINSEHDAQAAQIRTRLAQHKISDTEAAHLSQLNDQTRDAGLAAVSQHRLAEQITQRSQLEQQSLETQIAMAQIEEGMATTARERHAVALRILTLEEERERQAAQAIIDNPDSTPAERDQARGRIAAVADQHAGKVAQIDRQDASPMQAYVQQLRDGVGSAAAIHEQLETIEVRGITELTDGLAQSVTNALHLHGIFGEIVQDLIKMVLQQEELKLFGGGSGGGGGGLLGLIGGLFGGGGGGGASSVASGFTGLSSIGFASGGPIAGAGTGTSDSILAMLSNGEFVIRADMAKRYQPLLHAINDNRLPHFATGGPVGDLVPYRGPNLSRYAQQRRDRVDVNVHSTVAPSPLFAVEMETTAYRAVGNAAEPIMAGAQNRTMKALNRASLPGGMTG